MKALVTGAAGFLGSALVDRLVARGATDLALLVRPGGRARLAGALERHASRTRLEVREGSLASPDEAARVVGGADVVFHLAARMTGSPEAIFADTVVASKHLCEGVVASGRKPTIVLVSSLSVYGVGALQRGAVVDERTPLEARPAARDLYAQAKLRQERLFREYADRFAFPLVVVRPGVIYGPGAADPSARVGLVMGGVFLRLGGDNLLPLTYVDNCAEAVAVAAARGAAGEAYNAVDDDLPTCAEYLAAYRRASKRLRAVPVPYPALRAASLGLDALHRATGRRLLPAFSGYRVASTWAGHRFDNKKIKAIGWRQLVTTEEGLQRALASRQLV